MLRGEIWAVAVGLVVAVALAGAGQAGEAERKAEEPAQAAPPEAAAAVRPAGLVGTVVAFTPASRTLVVDIPLGKQVLRLGAWVTDRTKITAGGAPATPESLKEGTRVRVEFRRVADGDEATSIEVL